MDNGCAAYLLDILIGLIYWGVIGLLAFYGAYLLGQGATVLPIVMWVLAGILVLLIPLIQHWFRKKYGKKIDI
jgi:hypothetical protein